MEIITLTFLVRKIKKIKANRALRRNCNFEEFEADTQKFYDDINSLRAKPVVEGEEEDEEEDFETPEVQEKIREKTHDFWLGTILSKYPFFAYDFEHKKVSKKYYSNVKCKNCLKKLIGEEQKKPEKIWFSKRIKGFFCKACVHPDESDMSAFLS